MTCLIGQTGIQFRSLTGQGEREKVVVRDVEGAGFRNILFVSIPPPEVQPYRNTWRRVTGTSRVARGVHISAHARCPVSWRTNAGGVSFLIVPAQH